MCVIFLAYDVHPEFQLIVAANRDEYYKRPTAPARFWEDHPHILAGRDLEQMGTWMGITISGRFAAITNYRDPSPGLALAKSRGELVSNFLNSLDSPREYLEKVQAERSLYNGFNLLVGDMSSLWYYSKVGNTVEKVPSGIHGLSNDQLNTPWPKVELGKKLLKEYIFHPLFADQPECLFEILSRTDYAGDEDLPDTGVGLDWERVLSPIFIESPHYGTRSSTILLIDRQDRAIFIERTFLIGRNKWKEASYQMKLLR